MKYMSMDIGATERGRVSMANFYRPFHDGDRRIFRESPKYLEFIGALDASTPRHYQVVIPNYVTSHGNCLRISAFHRLCCVNECELLMTQLEAYEQALREASGSSRGRGDLALRHCVGTEKFVRVLGPRMERARGG